MKILICGLGLIGGSMARALKFSTENEVEGYDPGKTAAQKALLVGACDKVYFGEPSFSGYDVILLAAYPDAVVGLIDRHAAEVGKDTVVIDLCGTKRKVCKAGFEAAQKYGFTFIGGHPMAGTQFSGFESSRESLYKGATMILVPMKDIDVRKLDVAVKLFKSVGFAKVRVTDAENHDRIIAYTSELAHVLSNAYIKSPTAREHKGYSAGSFRDLTRVAHLNPRMWTELFLENRDNLIPEVERLAASLLEYADAMRNGDEKRLYDLLEEGRRVNDEIMKSDAE